MRIGNECHSIIALHDSSLLCGFIGGKLIRYHKGIYSTLGTPEIFNHKTITSLCQDEDKIIWIGTDGAGLFRYSEGTFTSFTIDDGIPSNHITSVVCDASGVVWTGTWEGLIRLQNGEHKTIKQPGGLLRNRILSLFFDTSERLWIGTRGGLNLMEGDQVQMVESDLLSSDADITAITADPSGDIWFSSNGEGLYRICQSTTTVQRITDQQGLPSNLIKCLFVDLESSIWIGFEGNFGLSHLQKRVVYIYTNEQGLSGNNILPLYTTTDNNVWIGNAKGGVDCYANGTFTQHGDSVRIGTNPVFTISEDKDHQIWIGGVDSLVIINRLERVRSLTPAGLDDNPLYHAIFTANDGAIWIGTNQGIVFIKDQDTIMLGIEDGLSDNKIFCFAEDASGDIWIGTQEGGLNRYQDGVISQISKREGLSDDMILCIHIDAAGIFWIGTANGGLNRIDISTGDIISFGSSEGLDDIITQIFEDELGHLWLGTGKGIISVAKNSLQQPLGSDQEKLDVQVFSFSDSDQFRNLNAGIFPAGCNLADGSLWFPTSDGIAVILPNVAHREVPFPHVAIQQVIVNSTPQPLSASYVFPPAVIHLEITFTAPSFLSPELIKFRYKLVGYDDDWVTYGTDRRAHYTKVPYGEYNFQVQVTNHLGQWSDEITSIPIKIKPYFYQQIWFLVLCGIVGLFILYAIYKYRIRQIREKELEVLVEARTKELLELNRELDQRVLDRTGELAAANQELEAFSYSVSHDLRAPVRRIEGLVDMLIEDYTDKFDDAGKDLMTKVAASSAEIGELIEEFLKLARIARQEIDKTDFNLSDMATEIMDELANEDPDRKVKVDIQSDIKATIDPRMMRIALYNLLGNAWKYTGKSTDPEVEFGLKKENNQQIFFIRDNGIGFDMGHYEKLFTPFLRLHSDDQFTGTGIGLATVKRIIMKHGGKIWATSEPGKGSTFFFTL